MVNIRHKRNTAKVRIFISAFLTTIILSGMVCGLATVNYAAASMGFRGSDSGYSLIMQEDMTLTVKTPERLGVFDLSRLNDTVRLRRTADALTLPRCVRLTERWILALNARLNRRSSNLKEQEYKRNAGLV